MAPQDVQLWLPVAAAECYPGIKCETCLRNVGARDFISHVMSPRPAAAIVT